MDAKNLTRAKDRATGEWVVGYYIGESGGDAYIIEPSAVKYDVGSIDTSPVHECDPKTVGRFTGLQDFHSSDNRRNVYFVVGAMLPTFVSNTICAVWLLLCLFPTWTRRITAVIVAMTKTILTLFAPTFTRR